eukprot:409526-Rhodomonas_salina.1
MQTMANCLDNLERETSCEPELFLEDSDSDLPVQLVSPFSSLQCLKLGVLREWLCWLYHTCTGMLLGAVGGNFLHLGEGAYFSHFKA